jgi:hypothetical protein
MMDSDEFQRLTTRCPSLLSELLANVAPWRSNQGDTKINKLYKYTLYACKLFSIMETKFRANETNYYNLIKYFH